MVLLACIICLCAGFGLGVVAAIGLQPREVMGEAGAEGGLIDCGWGESGAPLVKLGPGGDFDVTYSGLKYSKPVPGRWTHA